MADYKSYNARRGGRYGRGRFGAGRRGFKGPRSNYRFRSSNKKNGEHFLGPFSEDYVKEFLKIRNNEKLTKAELKKAEEEFIAKQPTEIQVYFLLYDYFYINIFFSRKSTRNLLKI